MKKFIDIFGKELFIKYIEEKEVLHKAVEYEIYPLIEFLIKYIDINVTNNRGETPFFFCKSLKMIDFLQQYKPNWNIVDKNNRDCLQIFTRLNYKEKNLMIKYIVDLKNNDKQNNQDKIEKTFLYMLKQQDTTKSEIVSFIKKYPNIDFSNIKDENGFPVVQILITQKKFLQIEIFPNIDYYYVNKEENVFTQLIKTFSYQLSKTKEEKFFKLLEKIFENPNKNMNFEIYESLLRFVTDKNNLRSFSFFLEKLSSKTEIYEKLFQVLDWEVGHFEKLKNYFKDSRDFGNLNREEKINQITNLFLPIIKKYQVPKFLMLNYSLFESQYSYLNDIKDKLENWEEIRSSVLKIKGLDEYENKFANLEKILQAQQEKEPKEFMNNLAIFLNFYLEKNENIELNQNIQNILINIDKKWIYLIEENFQNLKDNIEIQSIKNLLTYLRKKDLEKDLQINTIKSNKIKI